MDEEDTYIHELNGKSPEFRTQLAKQLEELVPEAVADGKVDVAKLKELLQSKGVKFQELAIDGDAVKREEMIKRSGRTTVPQIFIDAQHIGGCDDLYALDARGGLDPLLR